MLHFDRWKIVLIYVLCIAGLVYTAPNFIPKSQLNDVPDWLPNQQINLGLDLRGGSYLLLGLETDALVRERLQDLVNEVRSELRDESIPYTGLGIHNGQVVVNITNAADAERAREAIDGLSSVVAGNPVADCVPDAADASCSVFAPGSVMVVTGSDATVWGFAKVMAASPTCCSAGIAVSTTA